MKLYIFFLFAILSVTAYAQKEYTLDKEFLYHVSTNNILDVIDFNEVIEEYNYIPLNNVDGYIIGKIEQLFATDERIFVVTADGVYCYDFEGNPVYTITNKGNARNEFILCESVSISEDLLYMYDRGKMQIHVYETKKGKFLRNIASPSVLDLYRIGNAFVVEDVYHSLQKKSQLSFLCI